MNMRVADGQVALAHDGKTILQQIVADRSMTIGSPSAVFVGSQAEVDAEIKRLGLINPLAAEATVSVPVSVIAELSKPGIVDTKTCSDEAKAKIEAVLKAAVVAEAKG